MSGRLVLVDAASAYFRAFHGIPATVTSPDGRPVNAVRGLLDVLAHIVATRRPDELVCCWDVDWRPAWRVALIPSYKAHRLTVDDGGPDGPGTEQVPAALIGQVGLIRDVLAAAGIAVVGAEGYEADDVMATLAADGVRRGLEVDLVSGDRDLFQLADSGGGQQPPVRVVYTGRGNARVLILDDAAIASRYGIPAGTYADFATLRGDPSDGLPGVPGVGDRTAAQLLTRFGTLDDVVGAAEAGDPGLTASVRTKILSAADQLPAMKRVVRVVADIPIDVPPDGWPVPVVPADAGWWSRLVSEHGLRGSADRLAAALSWPTPGQ